MNKKNRAKPVILSKRDISSQEIQIFGSAQIRHINSGKKSRNFNNRDLHTYKASRKSCEDKRRYRDYEEAKRGLRTSKNRAQVEIADFGRTKLLASRIYFCPKCNGYHLSSKPDIFRGEAA